MKVKFNYVVLIVFAFVLSLQVSSPLTYLFNPDEGRALSNAIRVAGDKQYYLDFYTGAYGPLIAFVTAVFQFLCGYRLFGEVVLCLLGYLISYFLFYLLCVKLSGRRTLSFCVVFLFLLIMPRFYKYYILLGPAVFLYCLFYLTEKRSNKALVLLGFATAFVGLFRFDYGAFGIIISVIAILFLFNESISQRLKEIGIYLLSGMVLPLCAMLYISPQGNLADILATTLINVRGVSNSLTLPFPGFSFSSLMKANNFFFIAFWIFMIYPFLFLPVYLTANKSESLSKKIFLALCACLSIIFLFQSFHRLDVAHLMQVIPLQIPLVASVTSIAFYKDQRNYLFRFLSYLALAGIAASLPFSALAKDSLLSSCLIHRKDEAAAYFYNRIELRKYYAHQLAAEKDKWRIDVINFVHDHTSQNEYVCYLPFIPQSYYLSERLCATPVLAFFPGMQNDSITQTRYIESLMEKKVKWIVDLPAWSYDNLPERNISVYFPMMMKYIEANYPVRYYFGEAVVYSMQQVPVSEKRSSE